jgi:hypothetical protein
MLMKLRLSKSQIVLTHCTEKGDLENVFSSLGYYQGGKIDSNL